MKKSVQNIDIQVYIADASVLQDAILYHKLLATIPEYRREKVNHYKMVKDRNLSLAASLLLGHALKLAGYVENELEIAYGENDKPYFKGHPELSFNLSHSGERAMCAIAVADQPVGNEIGCDVEKNTPEQASFLKGYNMTVEQWTRMESYAKATQTDLEELFYGRARILPAFIFTHPEIEPQYEYNICCRCRIPVENIHLVDLKTLK